MGTGVYNAVRYKKTYANKTSTQEKLLEGVALR